MFGNMLGRWQELFCDVFRQFGAVLLEVSKIIEKQIQEG